MKVTFVSDTYAPQANGVARTLERLVLGLRERNHEVDVIRPAVLASDESGLGVRSFPLPGYDGLHVGFSSTFELTDRWKLNRPDVIYVATETPLGIAAIMAARDLRIPVVTGFHTNFQQYLSYYRLPGLEPLATAYLRTIHNWSLRTYVPCADVLQELEAQGFDNLALLPKGVDTRFFNPAKRDAHLRREWGVGDHETVGLYVGRMAPEKNLSLVAQAFTQMRELSPGFKGVFVGDGPQRAELEKQYPEFIFAGCRTGEDLARHYASADTFVFASTTETFGNVVLEAIASGLVTVAYRYAAAREHLVDGKNGFTAPLDDEEAFLDRCRHALDRRHWGDIRENARQTARQVSWSRVIDDFQFSLRELIREAPQRAQRALLSFP